MISCTEFIPAYSELFKFLESKGGKQAVYEYWEYLSDTVLDNLRDEARPYKLVFVIFPEFSGICELLSYMTQREYPAFITYGENVLPREGAVLSTGGEYSISINLLKEN